MERLYIYSYFRIHFKGQLGLFNEAELEANCAVVEPTLEVVAGYKCDTKKKTCEVLIKDLKVIEVPCTLHENDKDCPWCNTEIVPISKEQVPQEIQFIPAKVKIISYIRYAYECPAYKKDGSAVVIKVEASSTVMKHSLASPSSVAHVMYQKYVNVMPLYRQGKDWEQHGIKLSRATLANWVIRCSEDWLMPITEVLHKELLTRKVLHADKATVQVLNETGKKVETDSYMWLHRTGDDGKAPIILCDYKHSRGG